MNKKSSTPKKGKRRLKKEAKAIIIILILAAVIGIILACYKVVKGGLAAPSGPTTENSAKSSASDSSAKTNSTDSSFLETPTTSKTAKPKDEIINVVQKDGSVWNLKLVNKWNPIDESYNIPLKVYQTKYRTTSADERMIPFLDQLVAASKKVDKKIEIFPRSLHRSYARQKELYDYEVVSQKKTGVSQEEAERIAATIVARPGTSEHNTGLAVDFYFADIDGLLAECEFTDEYDWMIENCADYGFILRFPKDKEHITGVIFEPWHFRYVGKEAATYIMKNKITLEEYIAEIEGQDCY